MTFKRFLVAAAITGAVGLQAAQAQEQLLAGGVETGRAATENIYLFSPGTGDMLRNAADDSVFRALQGDTSVLSVDAIDFDARLLDGATQTFYLNFGPGLVLPVNQLNSYWLNDDYTAWIGEVDIGTDVKLSDKDFNPNQAVFVRSRDNNVFGQIRIEGQIFEVVTLEKGGGYLMVERDFGELGKGDDTPEKFGLPTAPVPPQKAFDEVVLEGDTRATSTIRVLQAASPQAINALGGGSATVSRMNFFLAQSNQVYSNNGLQIVLQDAGKYNSGQNERSTASSNVSGLANPSDGYLDAFAGSLRNQQAADLVALLVNTPNDPFICGIANGIGVSQSGGFFVIKHSCTDYTFVHEAGHLFGARHDNDPNTSPFSYGHGFVNTSGNFRTIMAVSSNPQPRIGLFSTDDQTVSGFAAGNSSFRDNERVHDVRRGTVAGFR